MANRFNNWALNLGILLSLSVALTLGYAFVTRVSSPVPDPYRLDNPGDLLGEFIQVEVLNSTRTDNLALQMQDYLRGYRFDVVNTKNYGGGVLEKTVIIDRIGNLDASQQVAIAIGLSEASISQDLNADYFLDATIIIGLDYKFIRPWGEPQAVDGTKEEQ